MVHKVLQVLKALMVVMARKVLLDYKAYKVLQVQLVWQVLLEVSLDLELNQLQLWVQDSAVIVHHFLLVVQVYLMETLQ